MNDATAIGSGLRIGRVTCDCSLCVESRKSNRPGALPPVRPAVAKVDLDWSAMPGRVHVADEAEPVPFFGLIFTLVAFAALDILTAGLTVLGGIVLARAIWYAGPHGAGLLHQIYIRLG